MVEDNDSNAPTSACALCGQPIDPLNHDLFMTSPTHAVPLHPECYQKVRNGARLPESAVPRTY